MGLEQLKNIIRENKEQAELDKQAEETANITECPDHAWPLKVNSKGEKSCPIDGRIWR